jgi:hypothetical protein
VEENEEPQELDGPQDGPQQDVSLSSCAGKPFDWFGRFIFFISETNSKENEDEDEADYETVSIVLNWAHAISSL